jgi:SAM-dependent methyltransferase
MSTATTTTTTSTTTTEYSSDKDYKFSGTSVTEYYDKLLGQQVFTPYAVDLIGRFSHGQLRGDILELGCGTGRCTEEILKNCEGCEESLTSFPKDMTTVVATDVSADMLAFAALRLAGRGRGRGGGVHATAAATSAANTTTDTTADADVSAASTSAAANAETTTAAAAVPLPPIPAVSVCLRWEVVNECALPYPDSSFDAVICQFGFMFAEGEWEGLSMDMDMDI